MSFLRSKATRFIAGAAVITTAFGLCTGAMAAERKLAGITLGSKAGTVLAKYGNPTRISVGTVSATVTVPGQPQAPVPQMNPYLAPMPLDMPMEGLTNPYAGSGYAIPPAAPGGMMMPSFPGMGAPGSQGPTPNMGQTQQTITQQEVTWTYEFTKGTAAGDTVEFIISEDGTVTQITVGGATPWVLSKTTYGIKLGDEYKSVLFKYGYPEGHAYAGKFLRASYVDKHHCMFTFLNKKVVGITIALPD